MDFSAVNRLKRFQSIAVIALALLMTQSNLIPARADVTQAEIIPFKDCLIDPESNCIVSMYVTTPGGSTYKGTLTEIHNSQDYYAGTFWHVKGEVPVYKFDGMKFAYGTNMVTLRSFYWPDNSQYCAYGTCTIHNESFITHLNPYAPGVNNPLFSSEVTFHMVVRVGNSFHATSSMGRAKNVKISSLGPTKTPLGVDKEVISSDFTPIHLEQTDFSSNDPTAAERAIAFEDSPTLWIYGRSTDSTIQLGPCAQSGGIDVFSNAISMDMPKWNTQTRSIDIWTKSPHLTTEGMINLGYIEARIPINMAKCMWGVNLIGEIQGKITMTYSDGTPDSIVTLTGNVNSGDYLLVIAGFHFSAPTFHLKLDDQMGAVQLPLVAKANKDLTCMKGKIIKFIKGTKCPAGFKKK